MSEKNTFPTWEEFRVGIRIHYLDYEINFFTKLSGFKWEGGVFMFSVSGTKPNTTLPKELAHKDFAVNRVNYEQVKSILETHRKQRIIEAQNQIKWLDEPSWKYWGKSNVTI